MCRVPSALAACAATGQNIDTNREHLRSHYTPKGLPNTAPKLPCSGPAHQIIAKAIEVLLRLEADQIVSAQRSDEREESAAEGLMFRGLSAGGESPLRTRL